MPRRKRGNPNLVGRRKALPAPSAAASPAPLAHSRAPQREVIEIHTTRERKRNASTGGGVFSNPRANKLALIGGAVAGGGATLLVAEKAGLSPAWAGAATGGLALAGSALLPNPMLKDACFAAGLGGMGVAGVQLLASFYAKKQQEAKAAGGPAKSGKRQADADSQHPFITRDELNQALSQIADKNEDQHKQACDLMTALHDEIEKVVKETQGAPGKPTTAPFLYPLRSTTRSASLFDDERNGRDEDDYMRNAYGDEPRDAYADEERNAFVDEYERNAYGDEPRDAFVDDERNAYGDERDADVDDGRNADVERDADAADAM